MKKRILCLILVLLMLQVCMIPAAAEELHEDNTVASPAPVSETIPDNTPAATQPSAEATQPPTEATQPSSEATQPSVEATQPTTESTTPSAACSHSYGNWNASETAHSRTCTLCGSTDSAGHTWYAELVTVAPTCKEGGGSAKVCTICGLILIVEITEPLTTHSYDSVCDASCNVCGLERAVTHTYNDIWTKSAKGHWHVCTVCGTSDEVKGHYPGPAATEEKEQICLTCGYVMMQKRNHTHKLNVAWTSDASAHWHACTGCSEQKDYAEHIFDNRCDVDCSICGYIRTSAHTYGTEWHADEKSHWVTCTICGKAGTAEAHSINAANTGCSICGNELDAAETTHEHFFDEDTWTLDDIRHWKTCTCGEVQNSEPHSWDDGQKINDSIIQYTCKICLTQKHEQIEQSSFPWLLVLLFLMMVLTIAAIIVCVILLRKQHRYSR